MKPHVVVIMADQLRYDFIGSRHMPNLNALLPDGCIFPNAYCAAPLCVPARAAFFTGRYPNSTGCLINAWAPQDKQRGLVPDEVANLYSVLAGRWDARHTGKQHLMYEPPLESRADTKVTWDNFDANYAPFLVARGHRAPGGPPFRTDVPELVANSFTTAMSYSTPATGRYEPGFDSFFDGYILNSTLDAIDQRDRTKPLFLSAMFLAPHPPFDIPEPWYSAVDDVELPSTVGQWCEGQSPLQLYNLTGFIGARYSREQWREVWRVYAGLVELLDHCIGKVVDKLKAEGLYDDTLIVFTTDHGDMLGSHRLWQKMCLYEEAIRTPLFFKPPGAASQMRRCDQPVSHLDVLPTICDMLGINAPEGLAGMSLAPFISGGDAPPQRDIFVQYDGNGGFGNFQRCIARGRQKLIVDTFKDECFFELYDLALDPLEEHNRVVEDHETAFDLLGVLIAHMRATADHLHLTPAMLENFISRRNSSSN